MYSRDPGRQVGRYRLNGTGQRIARAPILKVVQEKTAAPAAPSAWIPGLEGVVAVKTDISVVEDKRLTYRGYSIDDILKGKAEYEEVADLLLKREPPNKNP